VTDAAPLFNDLAKGPDDGVAHWLTAKDGRRIRVGHWGMSATRGTVIVFPGRTEYVEKYGFLASEMLRHGFACVSIDWRGQGLADRAAPAKTTGHVDDFDEFQLDVAAVFDHLRDTGLPEPFHLLGHSMGGCIGLRALMDGVPVASAVFSAPMWGLQIPQGLKQFAWVFSTIGIRAGLRYSVAPGQSPIEIPGIIAFDGNQLTADRERFDYFQRQIEAHPELGLGNASLGWLNAALREMRDLSRRPAPDVPCTTFLGGAEGIVAPDAIKTRMAGWAKGELVLLDGARHEVLLETQPNRDIAIQGAAELFARNS